MIETATAARIAITLGRSKRGVLMALGNVAPVEASSDTLTRGQAAQRWPVAVLPAAMHAELSLIAQRRGYRSVGHLLASPPERFVPSIPLAEVAAHHIEKAERLRRALHRAILARDTASGPELIEIGLADYRREIGVVSERHWRRVFQRTIDRDGGAEEFEDVALYLDDKLSRKDAAEKLVATKPGDRRLLDVCAGVANLLRPTAQERDLIWATVCEELNDRLNAGAKAKHSRREVVAILHASGVALAKNEDALRDAVKRKFEQWQSGGMTLAAIADRRGESSGWHRRMEISEDDRLAIIGRARLHCGGRVAQGVRECLARGLVSDEFAERFGAPAASKSYVPRAIRAVVSDDVKRLAPIHHGPREHKLRGAYPSRDWSGIAAGDFFQSDDLTPPVYYWKETARGIELMRGQFLPMVDERTTFVMGFVLISKPNYNSLAIRSLITTVCTEHGLPRRGFSFERGIWKSSKILTGSRTALPLSRADHGLKSLGMEIRNAKLPRAKVIERALGQLQDRMEGLRGYCGRDERGDPFERMQRAKLDVEAGRAPVNEHFLSEEEIAAEFEAIIAEYNEEPQEGRKLGGLSPREGWEQLQTQPRVRFDDRCLYLLAHDCRRLKVGRNGITIQIGKQSFNYKGEETGRRQGQTVLAWFNPSRPEVLACTDEAERDLFTVERSIDLPAWDCPQELLAEEQRKIAGHQRYATELYRTIRNPLPAAAFRANVVDRHTAERGAQMEEQRGAIETRSRRQYDLAAKVRSRAARAGLPIGVIGAADEDAVRGMELLNSIQRPTRATAPNPTANNQ